MEGHVIFQEDGFKEKTEICRSAQGVVYKVFAPTYGYCALKRFHNTLPFPPQFTNAERESLRELFHSYQLSRHPNIVSYYGVVYQGPTIVGFLSELMEGGNLLTAMESFKHMEFTVWAKIALRWSIQIARALTFCHSQNVIHRDIKPQNVVLTKDSLTAKLCDFGMARIDSGDQQLTAKRGTPFYIAPEAISDHRCDYNISVDVYSFGMLLYALFHRVEPFTCSDLLHNDLLFYHAIKKGVRPVLIQEISEDIRILISRCWATEPVQRPPIREVAEVLENHWNTLYLGERF